MRYTKKVLKNGLTLLMVPSSDAESVVVDFFVKTGSRSESPKENGISHFLEHFLFKGTKKYPTSLAISEIVDSIGGEMNASTGKEFTQYYIKAHHSYLALIFEVLTDMLQNPLLDKEELEREKGVIVEEINMYKDMPMAEIENVLEGTMWPKTALGRDIGGTKETVTKFTAEMFAKYMASHYRPGNMILGISGKFKTRHVEMLAKKFWTEVPNSRTTGWEKVKDTQNSGRVKIQYKDTQQAHLALGFKGLDFNSKKNPAASVLSAILGGGMSSRLFIEVRERRGLAYYVRSGNSNFQDTGMFQIGAGVQVGNIEEAIKVILEELVRIKSFLVDPKELKKAKEYIKGKNTLALEDNQVKLDWYLEQEAFNKKVQSPAEYFAEIDKVTTQDVRDVAKYFFQKKKVTLAVIGPYKSEKSFKKIVKV
jgi:predicted Zn-dependent peptidase